MGEKQGLSFGRDRSLATSKTYCPTIFSSILSCILVASEVKRISCWRTWAASVWMTFFNSEFTIKSALWFFFYFGLFGASVSSDCDVYSNSAAEIEGDLFLSATMRF